MRIKKFEDRDNIYDVSVLTDYPFNVVVIDDVYWSVYNDGAQILIEKFNTSSIMWMKHQELTVKQDTDIATALNIWATSRIDMTLVDYLNGVFNENT